MCIYERVDLCFVSPYMCIKFQVCRHFFCFFSRFFFVSLVLFLFYLFNFDSVLCACCNRSILFCCLRHHMLLLCFFFYFDHLADFSSQSNFYIFSFEIRMFLFFQLWFWFVCGLIYFFKFLFHFNTITSIRCLYSTSKATLLQSFRIRVRLKCKIHMNCALCYVFLLHTNYYLQ